jgi:hypothetical protein
LEIGETAMLEKQLERIEGKLDELLKIETRVATLEVRVSTHDVVAQEVVGLRNAAGLRDELRVLAGRVDTLEKSGERRQGVGEGVKLVWLALAGTPGMIAIAGLVYLVTHVK